MSAIFVVVPVLMSAGWPAVQAAAIAAATALGFTQREELSSQEEKKVERVEVEVEGASIIGDTLSREQELTFEKEGIVVTFYKDIRGRCGVQVCGEGLSRNQLLRLGRQISQRLIQEYVREKVIGELKKRGFQMVEEAVAPDRSIRLTVRKWG